LEYVDFLKEKCKFSKAMGIEIDPAEINPALKPHTRDIVRWAVAGGRRAIFAAFGLHKTATQLEIMRLIGAHESAMRLIVLPLGVRQEFKREIAERFTGDYGMDLRFIRRDSEIEDDRTVYMTNYESVREGLLNPGLFHAASLDEASVLRSYGSKTYQEFLPLFDGVKYRFVATATPSPNRFKELIHYAGFLGVMDTGQALTRFFKRDSSQAGNLQLHPHKEAEFYLWLHSWACFIQKPSDLGYSDEGYELPELDVRYHEVPSDYAAAGADRDGQNLMFPDIAMGVQAASAEKRNSLDNRIKQMGILIDGYIGRAQGLHGAVLGEEPGEVASQAAGTEQNQLPSQQGEVHGKVETLAGAESGTVQGADETLPASQSGKDEFQKQKLVCGEQAPGKSDQTGQQTEGLRPYSGTVPSDALRAERALFDLPDFNATTGSRSLPSNGDSSGAAVQEMQLSLGPVAGEYGSGAEGSPISDQIIIWCDLNDEQDAIERYLSARGLTYSSIHGSLTLEEGERRLQEWRDRKTYALIGKAVMLGQGVNLQQCNKAIFLGITYKFNDLIQAIHRIQRFGQTRRCHTHIIYSEAEREVLASLQEKWEQDKRMRVRMSEIIKEYGLSSLGFETDLARTIGVERIEAKGQHYHVANNDCVIEAQGMDENSVGLIVTSIPFSNHYEYTPSYNDFGHTENNSHFWQQMDYLTPELLRVLQPGRLYCCHVKDRILFGNVTGAGAPTVSPFHAEALFHGLKHGFDYMGMITVVTDVVRENNQTYRLGWSEQCKDGTKMGVGSPEYVLLFRKPQTDRSRGYADVPVVKSKEEYSRARWQVDAHAFWRSSGDRFLSADEMAGYGPDVLAKLFTERSLQTIYDYEQHIALGEALDERKALPSTFMSIAPGSHDDEVWHDVNRMFTLNSEQSARNLNNHICPLQFDIVDRLINRYSNKGEVVFDPFGGLFTVPYRAIKLGRKGRAVELNTGYYFDGLRYLQAVEKQVGMPSLFDFEEMGEAA
jgi:DNA modification methylase